MNATGYSMQKAKKEMASGFLSRFGIVIVALLICIAFSLASDKFLKLENIFNIFKQISIVAVLSIGMTFVFLVGGMDLSAGANVLLAAVTTGALITSKIMPAVPAMVVAIVCCGVAGLLNGVFVEKFRINPVIVTLGSQLAIKGVALLILRNYNQWIWMNKDETLKFINVGTIGPVPVILVMVLGLYIIAYLILMRTGYGRQVYAVGGNEKAAVLCGLKSVSVKMWCYIICGITAGMAGIIAACRLGMVNTQVGNGMEFDAVTAVVLGGASLKGGEANVLKTLVGAIIVGLIANFLTLNGVHPNFQKVVTGGFILLAAIINQLTIYKKA
jgi:ribose transport system permease protein